MANNTSEEKGRIVAAKKENENNDISKQPQKKNKKIGRNEPCFCGSGKKFKHCHGTL